MIGIFDSGIGGISVLNALTLAFPDECFIYVGDTARLPYGTKSPETVRKYSEQVLSFLNTKNVKAFVIACNTASSQFKDDFFAGKPVYNMVTCGAGVALKFSKNKKVLILATTGTVENKSPVHFLFPWLKRVFFLENW